MNNRVHRPVTIKIPIRTRRVPPTLSIARPCRRSHPDVLPARSSIQPTAGEAAAGEHDRSIGLARPHPEQLDLRRRDGPAVIRARMRRRGRLGRLPRWSLGYARFAISQRSGERSHDTAPRLRHGKDRREPEREHEAHQGSPRQRAVGAWHPRHPGAHAYGHDEQQEDEQHYDEHHPSTSHHADRTTSPFTSNGPGLKAETGGEGSDFYPSGQLGQQGSYGLLSGAMTLRLQRVGDSLVPIAPPLGRAVAV
jgi:hypothetical protein